MPKFTPVRVVAALTLVEAKYERIYKQYHTVFDRDKGSGTVTQTSK